jgi:hypothetical protein
MREPDGAPGTSPHRGGGENTLHGADTHTCQRVSNVASPGQCLRRAHEQSHTGFYSGPLAAPGINGDR